MKLWMPLALALVACKHEPPKPGEPVTFDTVCTAKYAETGDVTSPARKRVTLEGYLGAPKMMVCSNLSCSLNLYATPALDGTFVGVYFSVGDDANEMSKLPQDFKPSDVKLHSKDGKTVSIGAKVRLTGERMGAANETVCAIDKIDLIEAI